jgi:ribosomal-protein-alanine N-acetyltransferase
MQEQIPDITTHQLNVQRSSYRIRRMSFADIETVHKLDKLSFSLPWSKDSYQFELMQNPGSMQWVVEITYPDKDQEVVGMIVEWLVVDEAHIATLAVHPEHRKQGLGKQLLLVALREAIHRGMRTATLDVRASNVIAQKMYQQLGFEVVGRRPGYYRDNHEDAILMSINNLGDLPFDCLLDTDPATGEF